MTSATACAAALVDEFVRCGVREAVLSPGSRSAPLALAFAAADAAAALRLHVRIDERSAGFLALGLAKSSGRPVPVLTTSGTAAANLHPAVLEADHAGVPLVALTADRPASLRETGANQTTDQVKLYGSAVRAFHEIGSSAQSDDGNAAWRALVCRLVAAACGTRTRQPGPVHLNIAFTEPLVPTGTPVGETPAGRDGGVPWTRVDAASAPAPIVVEPGPRTLVLAGDDAGRRARLLAEEGSWPLLAEPSSGARTGPNALRAYRLLLSESALGADIERVVAYGHPTLSRPVTGLLSRDDVELLVVAPNGRWTDFGHRAARVAGSATTVPVPDDSGWLRSWRDADRVACSAVDAVLAAEPELTPYAVAAAVWSELPPRGLLVLGSSNPIRDVDLMASAHPVGERRKILANRGLSGIDGTVSTAIGAALGRKSSAAFALVGDLTFLHDANGLLLGPAEPSPDLTIVVVNDDGGGIFALLEQGAPDHAASFERVFGTPHGASLSALCAASSTTYERVGSGDELRAVLRRTTTELRVVEAPVRREGRRDLEQRIRDAVAAALR